MGRSLGFFFLGVAAAYAGAAVLHALAGLGILAVVLATVAVAWVACRLAPGRERAATFFATTSLFLFAAFWEPLHGRRPVGPWAEWESGLRMAAIYWPLTVLIGLVVAEPFRGRRREGEVEDVP